MKNAHAKLVAVMRGIASKTPDSEFDKLAADFLRAVALLRAAAKATDKSGDQVKAELEQVLKQNRIVLNLIRELSPQALYAIPERVEIPSEDERFAPIIIEAWFAPEALDKALMIALAQVASSPTRPGMKPGFLANGVAHRARHVFEILTADLQGQKPSFSGFLKQIYEALGIMANAEHYARKHPVKAPSQKP